MGGKMREVTIVGLLILYIYFPYNIFSQELSSIENFAQLRQELKSDITYIIDTRFESFEKRIDAKFQSVDAQFQRIDAKFQSIDAQFQNIDTRFQNFEKVVNTRFEDFEKIMDARFDSVEARFNSVEAGFNAMATKDDLLHTTWIIIASIVGSYLISVYALIKLSRTPEKPQDSNDQQTRPRHHGWQPAR